MRERLLGPTGLLLFVAGCGSAADRPDPDSVGVQKEAIINGDPSISPYFAYQFVMVFGPRGNCTGQLLQNDLVITARHCTTIDGTPGGSADTDPTHYYVTDPGVGFGPKVSHASLVVPFDPSVDVALLALNTFLEPDVRQRMQIYSGTDASLLGTSLNCMGYGDNTYIPGSPPGGSGWGTLRQATINVGATDPSSLTFYPNSSGQIAWQGDSGSTCIVPPTYPNILPLTMTGIASQPEEDGTQVNSVTYVGPEFFRSTALVWQQIMAVGDTMSTGAANQNNDSMVIIPAVTDSSARVTATPNQGNGSSWFNQNIGVWYGGSYAVVGNSWQVFRQDTNTMPLGQAFNVSTGGWTELATATSSNTTYDWTVIPNATDPSSLLIVTPVWTPSGSFNGLNNHPIGVWWTGSSWAVYNDDVATMPVGASFNVRWAFPWDGAYLHCTTSSNVTGRSTVLDNPNINGISNATVFVTHNWNPPGHGGAYLNHPTGVWYDGSHWLIANQDGAAMPTGICFNVMVRP